MPKDKGPFKFTTCAICGKQFIRQPGSIYHLRFADKTYQCCSYTCYRNATKVKEGTNEAIYKKFKYYK